MFWLITDAKSTKFETINHMFHARFNVYKGRAASESVYQMPILSVLLGHS